jgi:hypothetical protein
MSHDEAGMRNEPPSSSPQRSIAAAMNMTQGFLLATMYHDATMAR